MGRKKKVEDEEHRLEDVPEDIDLDFDLPEIDDDGEPVEYEEDDERFYDPPELCMSEEGIDEEDQVC